MRGRTIVALLALSLAVVAAGSAGAVGDPGFKTSQGSMLTQGDRPDVEFSPIITVGETLGELPLRVDPGRDLAHPPHPEARSTCT